MKGAIFYSGQYGSTAQYANWISDETGLPVYDIRDDKADPADFDFLLLGSSVIIYKLTIGKWARRRLPALRGKPVLLFTVSGAPAGEKLDEWVRASLPEKLLSSAKHVALRGRLDIKAVSWWARLILKIGAWTNRDPQARREEFYGFDYMDRRSIEPIVTWVRKQTAGTGAAAA